jgi:hypothetical protein
VRCDWRRESRRRCRPAVCQRAACRRTPAGCGSAADGVVERGHRGRFRSSAPSCRAAPASAAASAATARHVEHRGPRPVSGRTPALPNR